MATALLIQLLAMQAAAADSSEIRAPGYTSLSYPVPEPGTYRLPPLWEAADGDLLDSDGEPVRLHDLLQDRLVVMSFIYTHCNDVNGCPLATFVLSRLQGPIRQDPDLRRRVRLVTISFDPERDTPDVMGAYGQHFSEEGVDWQFLTGASPAELAPLLQAYDQSMQFSEDSAGVISHVLRVYLIDAEKRVRNVYNTSFLHADIILSDLRTILAD